MQVLYVNIMKRPSGVMSMAIAKDREQADSMEASRVKAKVHPDPARRVACIRVAVETLCVEGRYDA